MSTLSPTLHEAPASLRRKGRTLPELIERENRKRRKRTLLAWGALLAIPLAILVVWLVARPKPVPTAERFRTAPVTQGEVVRTVHATGHVEALTTVTVGAEVSGKIATVEVDYNDVVKKGQVLARFDRATLAAQSAQAGAVVTALEAALAQARTDRDQARVDLARVERLHATKAISDAERDVAVKAAQLAEDRVRAAEAQLAAQRASFSVARTTLDRAVIVSPIDGVVITRNVDPGQTVASMLQTPVLFTIAADLHKMRVIAAVDEADIGEVKPDQHATFTVNAYPDRTFDGVVTEVRNAAQIVQDVVTYGTVVEVENPDLALKPGMTASVRVVTASAKGVTRVPTSALHFTPPGEASHAGPGVWLLEGGNATRVAVTPGIADAENTQIAAGEIPLGTSVIVELTPKGRTAYGLKR